MNAPSYAGSAKWTGIQTQCVHPSSFLGPEKEQSTNEVTVFENNSNILPTPKEIVQALISFPKIETKYVMKMNGN